MVHRSSLLRSVVLIALVAMLCTTATNAQLPKRKMVIEKQTGAWCHACPSAAEAFDEIEEQYPDDVVLLAYHGSDGMDVPEQQTLQTAGYLDNTFPNTCLNRENVKLGPYAATAQAAGNIRNKMTSIVSVGFKTVNYSASTRNVQVELEAKFFEKHVGDKRFVLIIVEDSVTGTGQAFDQINSLNTDPNSKWYQKGNPMKNFYHRHVVRKAVVDLFGAPGSLPNTVQAGDVKTYTFNTKIENTWKPEKIHLVAYVAEYNSDPQVARRILNAEEEHLLIRPAKAELSVVKPYNSIKASEVIEKIITIKNTNASELTYDVSYDDEESQNDENWEVTVTPSNVKIAAGKTADIKVTVKANETINLATFSTINIKAVARPKTGFESRENTIPVYYLSDNAKYPLFYRGGPEKMQDEFMNSMQISEIYGTNAVKLPWSHELFEAYKNQFDGVTFQISGGYIEVVGNQIRTIYNPLPLAANDGSYPNFAKAILEVVNAGKSVFVTAPRSLWWVSADPNAAAGNVPEALSLFKDVLKVKFTRTAQRFTNNNNTYSVQNFPIKGVDGDPISDQLNGTANLGFEYHTMQADIMELLPGSTSVPIFSSDNQKGNIVGIRYENDKKGRVVFLTVPPEAFDNSYLRGQIITKSWDWLLEGKVDKPKVAKISSTVNSIDFKDVVMNKTSEQKFEIENTGEIPLVIKEIKLDGSNPEVFEMTSVQLPLSLEPGQKKEFTVTFAPKAEKTYLAIIQFVSNADGEESNSFTVDIEGKGVSDAPKPSVLKASVDNLDFGSVSVGSPMEKSLKIKNTSDQAIEILSVAFEGTNATNFSIVEKPELIPTNIELPFKVGFSGDKAGTFVATMVVTSKINESTQDVFRIDVKATAVASGVYDDAVSQSMKIEVGPNPASVQSQVNFTLNGTAPQAVEISVLDMKGSVVMSLHNGMLLTGNHSLSIAAEKLAAGAYKVIARTNNESVSVPLMIVR